MPQLLERNSASLSLESRLHCQYDNACVVVPASVGGEAMGVTVYISCVLHVFSFFGSLGCFDCLGWRFRMILEEYTQPRLESHIQRVKELLDTGFCMPLKVEISPSSFCNQKCWYCYTRGSEGKYKFNLRKDFFREIFDDMVRLNIPCALVQGRGEPLCNPDTVDAICEAKERGVQSIYLTTNGVLLTKEGIDKLCRSLTRMDVMRISVFESIPEIYAETHCVDVKQWHRLHENLCYLANKTRAFTLIATVYPFPNNALKIKDTVRMLKALRFDVASISYAQKAYYNQADIWTNITNDVLADINAAVELSDDSFLALHNSYWQRAGNEQVAKSCDALPLVCHITEKGEVQPCVRHLADMSYGFLWENDLETILRSDKARQIRRQITGHGPDGSNCHTCVHARLSNKIWALKHPSRFRNFV